MNPYVLRNIVAECFCVSIWKDTLGILIFIKNNVVTMENLNGNGTIVAFFAWSGYGPFFFLLQPKYVFIFYNLEVSPKG